MELTPAQLETTATVLLGALQTYRVSRSNTLEQLDRLAPRTDAYYDAEEDLLYFERRIAEVTEILEIIDPA